MTPGAADLLVRLVAPKMDIPTVPILSSALSRNQIISICLLVFIRCSTLDYNLFFPFLFFLFSFFAFVRLRVKAQGKPSSSCIEAFLCLGWFGLDFEKHSCTRTHGNEEKQLDFLQPSLGCCVPAVISLMQMMKQKRLYSFALFRYPPLALPLSAIDPRVTITMRKNLN